MPHKKRLPCSSLLIVRSKGLKSLYLVIEFDVAFFNMVVGDPCKSLLDRLKNLSCAIAGDGHANLTTDFFTSPLEDEIIWKGLQAGTLTVRKGTVLLIMIDMRAASARAGNSIRRFIGIESSINLTYACTLDIQTQFRWQVCCKGILPWLYVFEALHDDSRHIWQLVIRRVRWDRRFFKGLTTCPVGLWRRRSWSRRKEIKIEVLTDADDDDAVPCLWNTVFFELIEVREDVVACCVEIAHDLRQRTTLIGASQSPDILC